MRRSLFDVSGGASSVETGVERVSVVAQRPPFFRRSGSATTFVPCKLVRVFQASFLRQGRWTGVHEFWFACFTNVKNAALAVFKEGLSKRS